MNLTKPLQSVSSPLTGSHVRFSRQALVILLVLIATACFLVGHNGLAFAQNSLGIGASEQAITPKGPLAGLLFWINEEQKQFMRELTGALKTMRDEGTGTWAMITVSFLYGVFHAAGPGHGKAVISSYMIANEVAAKRGIYLSFVSALLQAFVAIFVIGMLALVLRGWGLRSGDVTQFLTVASYAGVTALGAYLLWAKLSGRDSCGHDHSHDHSHDHVHKHSHDHAKVHAHDHAHGLQLAHAGHSHSFAHGHSHDHHHHHHDHGGGHMHAPDPKALSGDFSFRGAVSAVLAVGIRPCTGALVVLTFAFLNGLYAAGILSTLAMAIGTGITVSALAILAVKAKDLAIRISKTQDKAQTIHRWIEVSGAAVVFLLGATLLSASLWG